MITIGLVGLILANWQERRAVKALRERCPELPPSISGVMAVLIALFGVLDPRARPEFLRRFIPRRCRANSHYKSSNQSTEALISSATRLPQASGYSSEVGRPWRRQDMSKIATAAFVKENRIVEFRKERRQRTGKRSQAHA